MRKNQEFKGEEERGVGVRYLYEGSRGPTHLVDTKTNKGNNQNIKKPSS